MPVLGVCGEGVLEGAYALAGSVGGRASAFDGLHDNQVVIFYNIKKDAVVPYPHAKGGRARIELLNVVGERVFGELVKSFLDPHLILGGKPFEISFCATCDDQPPIHI